MSELETTSSTVTETVTIEYPALKDFEEDVFNAVYPVMENLLPVGNFRSEEVPEPESFPLCTLIRMDSRPDWTRRSTASEEDLTVETYEAHAYALSMSECRKIMNTLAYRMDQMHFERLSMGPVLNGNDIRISHIVARFSHRIDGRGYMYR